MFPIFIPVFNNYTYTKRIIDQLRHLNYKDITILDNNSDFPPLVDYLDQISDEVKVIYLGQNLGPHFIFTDEKFYNNLPDLFYLSDPDIEFNEKMPHNFEQIFYDITNKYKIGKVGIALKILENEMYKTPDIFLESKSWKMTDWESQFWANKIGETDDADDIYLATIDTTFALYNKKFFNRNDRYHAMRIGGNFTGKHLGAEKKSIVPKLEEDFYAEKSRYSYFSGKYSETGSPVMQLTVHEYTQIQHELISLKNENYRLNKFTEFQNDQIQNFYNSRLWKFSLPLRSLFKYMKTFLFRN